MSMLLKDMVKGLPLEIRGRDDLKISSVELDSRKVKPGSLFAALRGTQTDGHAFIQKALDNGATAILCEEIPPEADASVSWLLAKNSRELIGPIASAFYAHPSKDLKVVGVTGTNGKTTVATLLYELYSALGFRCGLISTVQNIIDGESYVSTHTTPDAVSIQALLAAIRDKSCTHVFMEVSSHALDQGRVNGIEFDLAIFTNISHDHLDYHKTFDNYIKAKKQLFDLLDSSAFALVNNDDRNASVMVQNSKASVFRYALKKPADFKAKILEKDFNGMLLDMDGWEAWFQLVGSFNAYNLLAVYGTAFLLGADRQRVIEELSRVRPVRGRFETYRSTDGVTAIVDYAHTPDALENILKTISDIRSKNETLYTLFGCGGERDKEKRPVMGEIAARFSDRIILTSDNPRSENPETILDEIEKGVPAQHYKKLLRITDRKQAIKSAVLGAQPGDIVLVAGKGHETYQIIGQERNHFDDAAIIIEMFDLRNSY